MKDGRTAPRRTSDSPIARIRIERGLTQSQLAERVGCLQREISAWENGRRIPRADTLQKLARALECSLDDLV